MQVTTKVCSKCGVERSLKLFKTFKSSIFLPNDTIVDNSCLICTSKLSTKILSMNARFLKLSFKSYKKKIACKECGSKENIEFHHLNPKDKIDDIAHMVGTAKSIIDIQRELKKCVPLCPHCHAKAHSRPCNRKPSSVVKEINYEELVRLKFFYSLTKASKSYIFRLKELERKP